jgi:hypothetical protein
LRTRHDFLEQRIGVSDTPISGGGEVQRVGAQVILLSLFFCSVFLMQILIFVFKVYFIF